MPKLIAGILLGLATLPALSSPASAQQRMQLEPGTDWVHSHSQIIVPEMLGGLKRTSAVAYVADDLDSSVQFDTADQSEALSIYIYRNTNGAVPVWFAQAQMAIETRDIYAGPTLAEGPAILPLPGKAEAAGLRAIYMTGKGASYISTGVAIYGVGDWYLKIRASSTTRSADQMRVWMDEVIAGLFIPEELAAPFGVAPIAPCSGRLQTTGKSKDARKNMAADLMAGMLNLPPSGETNSDGEAATSEPSQIWCRDPGKYDGIDVFRPNASETSYLLALGDSGRGVWVAPDFAAALLSDEKSAKERYTITAFMPDVNINFVAQDRLPKPERAWDIVRSNKITSTVSTWGEDSAISIVP